MSQLLPGPARTVPPPFIVGPADDAILAALARYHFLTAFQVCRLLYSRGSLNLVRTHLKRLADAGYLQAIQLPRGSKGGSLPMRYTLARKGRQYLEGLGVELHIRYRPSDEYGWLFYEHTREANDFLIGAELFDRSRPDITLIAVLTERELRGRPGVVALKDGATLTVTCDGWLDFHLLTLRKRRCFLLELDRGTEGQAKWRRKVAGLLAYTQGPKSAYEHDFGTPTVTVCVVAVPGDNRRSDVGDLIRWTGLELEARGLEQEADLFRFTDLPADSDPTELFLANRWSIPFQPTPVSILGQSQEPPA